MGLGQLFSKGPIHIRDVCIGFFKYMNNPFSNKKEIKVPGKTYTFSTEEKDALKSHFALIAMQQSLLNALKNEVQRLLMAAKDRVSIDPYIHVQVDYDKWTFFVPDIKVKSDATKSEESNS